MNDVAVLDVIEEDLPEPLGLVPDAVEVRRNGGLSALVGVVASAVAIAYLARATSSGAWVDWLLVVVMGALGVVHLLNFVDARTPLLVADTHGVRIRLGRTWRGTPWGALARVELRPRRGLLRDGLLVLVARNDDRVLADLDAAGRRQSRFAQRVYGAPLAVPLALSTRVVGADRGLLAALSALAGEATPVVEIAWVSPTDAAETEGRPEDEEAEVDDASLAAGAPAHTPLTDVPAPAGADLADPIAEDESTDAADDSRPRWHDPRPLVARTIGAVASRLERRADRRRDQEAAGADLEAESEPEDGPDLVEDDLHPSEQPEPRTSLVPSTTPSPLRAPITAIRAEIRSDLSLGATALAPDQDGSSSRRDLPEARELRRPGSVNLVEDTVVWGDRVSPIARAGSGVEPLVIDDFAAEPAEDPVIGPELAAARTRLSLSVDQLADRTRIRPHVIESIEVDDFVPCGGDFYARGHLRTLARVLGIDVAPLLVAYDDRYAAADVNPRRVFESELATGVTGSIRSTRGGPNWSLLVAVVMTLILAWSIARLVMDSPVQITPPAPQLNGSAGPNNSIQLLGDPVPVVLHAVGGGANVVVRDGAGNVIFSGNLSFNESRTLQRVAPPVRVQSSDGSVTVTVDGEDRGALGTDGQPAQNTFTVR